MPPALIIFDCDGVLVDSEPITNGIIARDLTEHGLPMTPQQCIDLFVGGTIASVADRARSMGAALPDDWVARFYDRMISALADEVEAVPGIHGVLDKLDSAGIPYCVASNGPMRKMEVTLARTGLWDRMAGRIHSAHDVGIAKPDPGLFLHAARTQDTEPGAAIVIEDSVSGVRAAQAAGMRCLGYSADTPAHALAEHGAHPFDDMGLLPGLLNLD